MPCDSAGGSHGTKPHKSFKPRRHTPSPPHAQTFPNGTEHIPRLRIGGTRCCTFYCRTDSPTVKTTPDHHSIGAISLRAAQHTRTLTASRNGVGTFGDVLAKTDFRVAPSRGSRTNSRT